MLFKLFNFLFKNIKQIYLIYFMFKKLMFLSIFYKNYKLIEIKT